MRVSGSVATGGYSGEPDPALLRIPPWAGPTQEWRARNEEKGKDVQAILAEKAARKEREYKQPMVFGSTRRRRMDDPPSNT